MKKIKWENYDLIHCGLSGGKDSQAAATWLIQDSGIDKNKILLSFCDTGNEHEFTYKHLEYIQNILNHPIEWIKADLDFYQLAKKKGRFPSAKARFCTQYLKMQVTQKYILKFMQEGLRILLITGVRRDESAKRSKLPKFEFDTYYACDVYRPLIDWSLKKVLAYLKDKGQEINPLYGFGARRVGCFPCVMSNKKEIRTIAENFPERIDMIREWENKINSSFFTSSTVPAPFRKHEFSRNGRSYQIPTIDDVVEWSKTAYHKPDQFEFYFPEGAICINNSGACE